MVLKLIKNDIKESKDKFLPVVMVIPVMAVLLNISIAFENSVNTIILILVPVVFALIVASVVLSVMAFIDLLYTSLYDRKAYKTFTLPVKTWEIYASRIVTYWFWQIIILLVIMVTVFVTVLINTSFYSVQQSLDLIFSVLSQIDFVTVLVGIFHFFTDNIMTLTVFLFAGSVINSSYVQNHRKIKMFILYLILMVTISNVFGRFIVNQDNLLSFNVALESLDHLENLKNVITVSVNPNGQKAYLLMGALYSIISAILFIATTWFWDNKLEVIE